MRSEKFEFEGHEGQRLAARVERPDGAPRACALFAHCFTCTKDSHAAVRIARGLVARGFAVLRFDFTGLGGSEGDFANTNFSSNVGDLLAAAAQLRARVGDGALPLLLVGHSLGGAAVLAAAGEIEGVSAVATIGAPSDPAHVTGLFQARLPEIEARGEAEVSLGGRPFRIRRQLIEDLQEQRLRAAIGALRRPLLVLHAPRDQIVGIEHATQIVTAAKHPKSFVSLDDADHLLSRRADAEYVAELLSAWASRYLETSASSAEASPAEGAVVVRETGAGRFQNEVRVGRHRMLADEPRAVGGDDAGPGPYDFLLTALGACTSMTLRMYAERKGWPVEGLRVTLRHAKVHAEDCAGCDESSKAAKAKIDRIEREIEIAGPLDEDQRARMLTIADKCPVHRTLHGPVKVHTTLRDAES